MTSSLYEGARTEVDQLHDHLLSEVRRLDAEYRPAPFLDRALATGGSHFSATTPKSTCGSTGVSKERKRKKKRLFLKIS